MKEVALEAVLYSQVMMIRHQTVVYKEQEILSDHKLEYYFQVYSERSQHLFDIDHEWTEEKILQGSQTSSKVSIKNIYHDMPKNTSLHFLCQ